MYRIERTPEYDLELQQIEAGAGVLDQKLQSGAHFVLARTPETGWSIHGTDLWLRSQVILPGLLMVRLYYRIDEIQRTVTLVSMRAVNMTVL